MSENVINKSFEISSNQNRSRLIFSSTVFLFLMMIVVNTSDIDLLQLDALFPLLIIKLEIPIKLFYLVSPFLIFSLHLFVFVNLNEHLKLAELWAKTKINKQAKFPFLINFLLFDYSSNTFVKQIVFYICFLLYFIFPLSALVFILFRFADYQSLAFTFYHFLLVILDVIIIYKLTKGGNVSNLLLGEKWQKFQVKFFLLSIVIISLFFCILVALINYSPFTVKSLKQHFYFPSLEISKQDVNDRLLANSKLKSKHLNLSSFDMTGRNINFIKLSNVDFTGVKLSSVKASFGYFDDVIFSNSQLNETRFSNSHFNKVSFEEAQISNSDFAHCTFDNSRLKNSRLNGNNFQFCNVKNSNLIELDWYETKGDFIKISSSNLDQSYFYGKNSSLTFAEISGAEFNNARFTEVNMDGISLTNSRLIGAQFRSVSSTAPSFVNTNLSASYFKKVDIFSANFNHTAFIGSIFETVNILASEFYPSDFNNCIMINMELTGTDFKKNNHYDIPEGKCIAFNENPTYQEENILKIKNKITQTIMKFNGIHKGREYKVLKNALERLNYIESKDLIIKNRPELLEVFYKKALFKSRQNNKKNASPIFKSVTLGSPENLLNSHSENQIENLKQLSCKNKYAARAYVSNYFDFRGSWLGVYNIPKYSDYFTVSALLNYMSEHCPEHIDYASKKFGFGKSIETVMGTIIIQLGSEKSPMP
ncbi:pentapeptide repeat-containing protein [Pseudoalteromonas ulvae]|uniref:Pentapeptide repeat-containing protein n=1 Tax=Pseudoalteromonas ulvae TaxID=107327 RepID=A0A244CWG2_PSEDV|nr:pentapeptide repeat-containing protein [Pseudoalteromonas ulvae]OUL59579.1 hypothetical protein B1199_04875 [Pseudoalteromonas ulvae]